MNRSVEASLSHGIGLFRTVYNARPLQRRNFPGDVVIHTGLHGSDRANFNAHQSLRRFGRVKCHRASDALCG